MSEDLNKLRELAEAATPGPWHHCQPFMVIPAQKTVHGTVPAERVDYVSTWPDRGTPPGHRVVVPMPPECGPGVRSADMAFIAAFNPATALSLLSRLQAAEERAEKLEGQASFLITRLEQAEAGNPNLDLALIVAVSGVASAYPVPAYTTSLDAIVALIGEKLPGWNVTIRIPSDPKHKHVCELGAPDNPDASITDPWPFRTSAGGSNAPLACAAALLRAIKDGEHG